MPAAAAAVLPRPPALCAECDRVIPFHTGVGEFACECGAVHGHHINEDAEYRCFADEEGQEEKKRAEAYTREDEIGAPMAAGLASSDKMRRWADSRVNQVKQMLAHLVREEPGRAVLSEDEYRAAMMLCRAAAFHQASLPEDSAEQQTASALFWAIALAQNVAARRPGGWFVDSEPAAAAWGMDALSEYISCFQSESYVTAERLGNATRARGGVAQAAALVHDAKRRKLRIDSLGSAEARRTKLLALDALLVAAGCDGLDARVKQHRAWHKRCWRPLAPPRLVSLGLSLVSLGHGQPPPRSGRSHASGLPSRRNQELPQVRARLQVGRTRACLAARASRWDEQIARRRGARPAFGRLGSGLRAQVSRARGRTKAGPWKGDGPFPCHTPCVPNAAVPSVARTDLTRTTPIRTWRRQSRLARLRRPERAARCGLARRLPQPTLMTTHLAPPPR